MTRNHRRIGFTLAELLVVIAIIGILSGFLLPVVGKARHHAKIALAKSMLGQLETALADYIADHGVYPPEKGSGSLDKPSETLYFYLVGMDITAPTARMRTVLRNQRKNAKVYFEFMSDYLEDCDGANGDDHYEVVDPWGQPWVYVRGMYPGHPNTSSGLGDTNKRPWHHPSGYDLFSVGPDGITGSPNASTMKKWNDARRFEWPPNDPKSFYKLAAGTYEGGTDPDDISNF